ncbi:MAG: HAD family hydrolase [Phycisphaerae bacterium]
MKYKAVLFDFGDTIVNFGPFSQRKLAKEACEDSYRYLASLGQKLPSMRWYTLRVMITMKLMLIWSDITGIDFDAMNVIRSIGRKYGHSLTEKQWLELLRLWYRPLMDLGEVEEGIIDTFNKLHEMGLKLGIVSNTFAGAEALDHHLEKLGLLDYFPVRVYSCNHKFRKPDKRIFEHAAAEIGVGPDETVFVGDRFETDVAGSISCGMLPVLKQAYTNDGKPAHPYAQSITELKELPELIKRHSKA